MIKSLIKKFVGSKNERTLKKMLPKVQQINALETEYSSLSDEKLKAKTQEFRERLKNAKLNDILPEAFAAVRQASMRTLGLRHFDVQLIGGMVLHEGKIAEMRTGEGKTLIATLAAYLNALPQKSVHIVTVNDYLAKRDAKWMEPIYNFLGLTVGVIYPNQSLEEKKEAYNCDIIYGTNNELGFDYLRDNMVFSMDDKMQKDLSFAIIDEVDSILIDEARTPLIISGPSENSSEFYLKINKIIPSLKKQIKKDGEGDYELDEKTKQAFLTEQGHKRVEELFIRDGIIKRDESLYSPSNIILMHYLNASLRAHALYQKDVDYIVKNGEVVIVDEHTGRTMEGRRWSDGLHQAIEAKEGVNIQQENQTLASITFQNYFRLYEKLSGMTGTADTEAYEFHEIYNLDVVVIPTNRPMIRKDLIDQIYLSAKEKFNMVIEDIKQCKKRGQPVLVGTVSVEVSEYLSSLLNKAKINHQVLNAKQHEREAIIVAQAGKPGAVTIATNMAGRGTDIVLGGNLDVQIKALEEPNEEKVNKLKDEWQKEHDQVIKAGGLHIIGSERHESRRIDNQLRGRSGRQGDPGSSRFYLSLEDNLMRIFASEKLGAFMRRLGMKENEAIEHRFVSKAIENAQRKVEAHNFDIRKQLLEYDDVANEQRKIVYQQRDELMKTEDISDAIKSLQENVIKDAITRFIPPQSLEEQWDIEGLEKSIKQDFNLSLDIAKWLKEDETLHEEILKEKILNEFENAYNEKEEKFGSELMRQLERTIMLQILDSKWVEHLLEMDHLREGIHLRGYAQQDPKQAYKLEGFKMFQEMLESLKYEVLSTLYSVEIREESDVDEINQQQREQALKQQISFMHADLDSTNTIIETETNMDTTFEEKTSPVTRDVPKTGRNELCPCGSGKKFKYCCGLQKTKVQK